MRELAGLTLATVSGFPPFADTRMMPLLPWPKKMVSPFQLIPNIWSASHTVTAAPPESPILLIVLSACAKYAIDRPSGENTGFPGVLPALSAPVTGLTSRSDSDRR